jgi:TRAP transporter 4TM/12TM fusion protein
VTLVAAGLCAYAVWWVFDPLPAQKYRSSFAAVTLGLTMVVYRGRRRRGDRPGPSDLLLGLAAVAVFCYPLVEFDSFVRRAARPTDTDVLFGVGAVLVTLEAARRTVGWILPAVCVAFLGYAYLGDLIPRGMLLGHRGYDTERLVGHLYMGLEGLFGVPLDVAATYIVLFTLYGAVLEVSGASKFFVDLSAAVFGRSGSAPGRTTAAAGFLLGTVSGSGVATTVSLGPVAWPMLRRAGYPPERAGGVLAASGIGAILSPPTLGAAAFIIAELLRVSYLRVLLYATVPTVLYYAGVLLAVEADSHRFRVIETGVPGPSAARLLARFGYHFSSLGLIVVLMATGMSAFRAVVLATAVAFALSFLDPQHRMGPRRVFDALAKGALGVLPVAATTAAAGIIVGVVTLTGLGLKASSMIVDAAGGNRPLTALFAAAAVLLLGLAVPVTASFVISAVIVAPALTGLDVSPEAAYMFVFYYAVLSEVSPPTALSAVAAAACTGGDAYRTMWQTWKYTLPAFLVPFAFVLSPNGEHLLGLGSAGGVAWVLAVSLAGVGALSLATGGWLWGPAGGPVRAAAAVSALLLLYLEPVSVVAGLAVGAGCVAWQWGQREERVR